MSYGGFEYGTNDPFGAAAGGNWNGGGGGGGGFLPGGNDVGGEGQQQQSGFGSPDGGGGGKMSRDQKTLLPVTVHQLNSAAQTEPDDHFRIDNVELNQVKIVGQVIDVEETATTRLYKIDDGTGVITCKIFVDQDENDYQQERRALCGKGAYVSVVGQIREYQGQRSLNGHDMRPIKEGNEITYHMLDSMFVHCCNTKGRPAQKGRPAGGASNGGGAFGGQLGTGGYGNGRGDMGGGGMGGAGMAGGNGFTDVQDAVLQNFGSDMSDAGVDVSVVIRQMGHRGITAQQVREAIDFLAGEGHIYTTTDENHYKATG